jgi:aryl-alcohol dehydrogenase-like predicted oxidoreductase
LTFSVLAEIRDLARQQAVSMGHLSLVWLLSQPAVTSVVVGARNAAQARDNAAAAELQLDEETATCLTRLTDPIKQSIGHNVDPWEHDSRMERPTR